MAALATRDPRPQPPCAIRATATRARDRRLATRARDPLPAAMGRRGRWKAGASAGMGQRGGGKPGGPRPRLAPVAATRLASEVAAESPVTYRPSQCLTSDLPVTYPVTYLAHPIN